MTTFNVQGNNTEAIKSLQGEALKNNPDSFGVQVSFPHIMEVLRRNTEGASIKSIYVELLQGQLLQTVMLEHEIVNFV